MQLETSAALAFFPLRPLRELHLKSALLTQIEHQSTIVNLQSTISPVANYFPLYTPSPHSIKS